jgi:feruloyl esterase
VALAALAVAVIGLAPAASGTTAAASGTTAAASGAAAGAGGAIRPVRACADLAGDYGIAGAAAHVTAAPVPAANGQPEYCDVRGYVEPAVDFQLKLPTTYNGRYVQYGCMGLCGTIFPTTFPACGQAPGGTPGGDFAVAATDDGHVGKGGFFAIFDGSWAANDQAARDDYFYRAPHAVSLASKRIIAAYYGSPPARSYFDGCSTGGREGLLLAQRYPHDFNGIVAGSPAAFMGPLFGVYWTWLVRVNIDAHGAPILTGAKLPALHDAAMAACDRLDGLTDGQIDAPQDCRFDPASIQCPPGTDNANCLTPAQVDVVRKAYGGPVDARGERLYPGGVPRGSELSWEGFFVPHPQFGSIAPLPDNYLKYVGYPIGAPASSVAGFTFTVSELNRLTPEGIKGNALSLDLRNFQRAGGKLIIWQGWADGNISVFGTLDYYQRLWQANGGLAATQRWARLFMVPTLYHCGLGGYQLNTFDPFPELVAWVEHGHPPTRVIASEQDASGNVARTRPVFPYPQRAAYIGSGSIDDAHNFAPTPPPVPPHDVIDWAGAYLYHIPGPVATS